MKGLTRCTLVLMGLTLVLMVGPLWKYRTQHVALPLMIARAADPHTGQFRLYRTALGSTLHPAITTPFDDLYYVAGPTPDGWVYFEGVEQIANGLSGTLDNWVGLYRVQINGAHQQRLVGPMKANQWGYTTALTADHQTLIYSVLAQGSGYSQVYRANADGTGATAITPTDWHVVPQLVIQDRLIAHAYFGLDGPYLIQMKLDGSDVQPLTEDFGSPQLTGWLPEDGWLLVTARSRLWKMRLDGTERSPIGPPNMDGLVAWLPAEQIIVVTGRRDDATSRGFLYTTLWGIHLSDGAVLWEWPSTVWGGVSADGHWVATLTYRYDNNQSYVVGSVIERMHPDGTGRERVVESDRIISDVQWSADNQSLYYVVLGKTDGKSLWRINLRDGTQVERPLNRAFGSLAIWSPDQRYGLDGVHWVELASGRQGTILPQLTMSQFVAWVNAPERRWSPIGLLILGSVLLLGGLYRGGGKGTA